MGMLMSAFETYILFNVILSQCRPLFYASCFLFQMFLEQREQQVLMDLREILAIEEQLVSIVDFELSQCQSCYNIPMVINTICIIVY